ncbi:hypothetical protein SKAU_G00065560 [Synaphobranchus kaupii]|uniref:Uncharacterized protein n=1 Tax=Synaphobranchus kaupii TaxID=118154 RepID=A0A9Q1JA18_SYNKA|nr:hypothetical protein SKAU_G00065560 [Synaphobranchus kaupii]
MRKPSLNTWSRGAPGGGARCFLLRQLQRGLCLQMHSVRRSPFDDVSSQRQNVFSSVFLLLLQGQAVLAVRSSLQPTPRSLILT